MRRRKPQSRTPRYPRRWPAVVFWSAWVIGAFWLLTRLAALVARDPKTIDSDVLKTAAETGPAVALAFACLIAAAFGLRHLWLDLLTWLPGRIDVPTFTAGSQLSAAELERYTMAFRERLSTLRLQSPTPVPGAAPDGDFLDVLGRGTMDSGNVVGTLVTLLRSAIPTHAWQVNGVLAQRETAPRCGVKVQVVRLPNRGNPPEALWGGTWDEVVQLAADHATATILTRTHLCRSPWSSWRHYVLPGELFNAYERAAKLEEQRRYDEALDAYYRALDHDPMNMVIRLRIGQLQEKLALYLDALVTYQGVEEIFRRRSMRHNGYRRLARAERRHAVLIARYRRLVLLGGNKLTSQWRTTGDGKRWSKRDQRRQELRARLTRQLRPALEEACTHPPRSALRRGRRERVCTAKVKALLQEPKCGVSPNTDKEQELRWQLREVFGLLALRDLPGVLRKARFRGGELTATSVRLTRVCIEERLDWVQTQLGGEPLWPPDVETLDGYVERASHRWSRRWHEDYNAACIYALPLRVHRKDPLRPDQAEELARRAVKRLARATEHASSVYIGSHRDWLVSEDPDLDGLRIEPVFKDFEAVYFPGDLMTPPRPRLVHKLQATRYIRSLLVETARHWEREWHARGKRVGERPDVHTMLAWWNDECEAWRLVRSVAVDFRHWRARLELIAKMQDWSASYGVDSLEVGFATYEREPLKKVDPPGTAPGDTVAARAVDRGVARLASLVDILPDLDEPTDARALLAQIRRWQTTLRQLDARAREPRWIPLEELCDHHAALWQRLGEWLAVELDAADYRQQRIFERELEETSRLWKRTYRAWRRHDPLHALGVRRTAANGHVPAAPVS